jgi:hypothetical protein
MKDSWAGMAGKNDVRRYEEISCSESLIKGGAGEGGAGLGLIFLRRWIAVNNQYSTFPQQPASGFAMQQHIGIAGGNFWIRRYDAEQACGDDPERILADPIPMGSFVEAAAEQGGTPAGCEIGVHPVAIHQKTHVFIVNHREKRRRKVFP